MKKKCVSIYEIENWCDQYLNASLFKDYCPNGLQVEAATEISKLVTGVTACEALIDAAIENEAQAILVHHGYFWKGESPILVGMKGRRVKKLFQHGVSLLAYHLPLDAHPVVGNNVQLIDSLGLNCSEPLYPDVKHNKNLVGEIVNLEKTISIDEIKTRLTNVLNREPLHISAGNKVLKRIAICTGGAQGFITQASKMDCDAYISGEISERTTHEAREMGIEYFACGHHATEKGGVLALGHKISEQFGIDVTFIDIENPA